MAFKFVAVFALLAVANAGLLGSPVAYSAGYASPYAASPYAGNYGAVAPALTSQSSNILRSYGNLGQVSTYSKTIDTPYSSVSKSDVRVSNPGYATYAAPAVHAAYAAPALSYASHAAPALSYAAPAVHSAYAAPALSYAAPAVHSAYAAPALSYAAPAVHSAYAPAVHSAYAPAVHASPAIGVAYSAAPVVSHVSYSNGLGLNYGW